MAAFPAFLLRSLLQKYCKEKLVWRILKGIESGGPSGADGCFLKREVYRSGRLGNKRLYNYNGKYYLRTGIETNGYIVSAYPLNKADAVKLIERHKP